MLVSMTGFGEGRAQSEALTVVVDIRAVNNRHLKVTVRAPEPWHTRESDFEKVVRRCVRRGSAQVHVRLERAARLDDYRLNPVALRSYVEQVQRTLAECNLQPATLNGILAGVVNLPGVADAPVTSSDEADEWPVIEQALERALANLQAMRCEEGLAMGRELLALCGQIADELEAVRALAPTVAASYRDRLLERLRLLLNGSDVALKPDDVMREVALFADRCDVSEEVVRLGSHLEQLRDVIAQGDDSAGRKLEFLAQEMVREANTIGSKAGDVQVSRHVVAVKAALEKVRELIQNVE